MPPTVMLSHYLWCIPICQVFFNLFTVVCIMKTTSMLSASSIYIQASLCLTPNQKQNPAVIISSSSPNANMMKILGLITRLGISSSLGVAWKTEYILYHLEGSISPSVKYRSCSTGLENPLPLFYVVIFWILLYPIHVN